MCSVKLLNVTQLFSPTLPDLATLLLYKTWLYSHVAKQQLVALPVKYITSACADCTEAPQWPFRHTETAREAADLSNHDQIMLSS